MLSRLVRLIKVDIFKWCNIVSVR